MATTVEVVDGKTRYDGRTLAEWVPELHDDLIRWTLWSKDRAVVSHETALAVQGIGEFESPRVHLTAPPGFSMRDDAVVLHHADLPDVDIIEQAGFRTTTAVRSLVDMAAVGADEAQLARAIHEAAESGYLTLRQLRVRAELVNVKGALRIERAIHRIEVT